MSTAEEFVASALNGNSSEGSGGDKKEKQSDVIIKLVLERTELFHAPDGTGFADVQVKGHRETWRIGSSQFRLWATRLFYETRRSAPNSDGMQSALKVLESKARFDGKERAVNVRVAGFEDRLYVDLGTAEWSAVEIDATGWRVIPNPPVRFRRAKGCLPLPVPARGGNVEELRRFLNVKSEDDFAMVVAFLVAALRNRGPYPVLVLTGVQGAAKSTLARIVKALIDPNTVPLRALPRDERDLFIAANNGYALIFDNVSALTPWTSDALAKLATGGGFATRELYTDAEETLFDAQRPIVLNGIEDFVTRADLADRSLTLSLPEISADKRIDEKSFRADFSSAAPRILGALLDAVAHGLKMLPETKLDHKPRMADFALWMAACEGALSWPTGTFIRAYEGNRLESVHTVVEADAIATAVRDLLAKETEWEGTAAALLKVLTDAVPEDTRKQKTWPRTARGLSGALRRVTPDLRKLGYTVELDERDKSKERKRIYHLAAPANAGQQSSKPSEPSEASGCDDLSSDGRADDVVSSPRQSSDEPSGQTPSKGGRSGDLDDLDGLEPDLTDERPIDTLMPRKKVAL